MALMLGLRPVGRAGMAAGAAFAGGGDSGKRAGGDRAGAGRLPLRPSTRMEAVPQGERLRTALIDS